jgi:hypothetical protein
MSEPIALNMNRLLAALSTDAWQRLLPHAS